MLNIALCSLALMSPLPGQDAAIAPTDQAVAPLGQESDQTFKMKWSLDGGYAYQLRTRINDGGRLTWGRAHAHLKGQMPINDELDLLVGLLD